MAAITEIIRDKKFEDDNETAYFELLRHAFLECSTNRTVSKIDTLNDRMGTETDLGPYDKLYRKTIELYRDAATPPIRDSNSVTKYTPDTVTRRSYPIRSIPNYPASNNISPARYLAANLKTDISN